MAPPRVSVSAPVGEPVLPPRSNSVRAVPYAVEVEAPIGTDDWLGLTESPLPLQRASEWVLLPSCGAVVSFSGHARDHSEGRDGVTALEYEAYESQVEPKLAELAVEMRRRWTDLGRIVMLHRFGPLDVTEAAVVVVVSSPHRDAAFEAARFGIDALKSSVPIWKRETWQDGESWGLEPQHVEPAAHQP